MPRRRRPRPCHKTGWEEARVKRTRADGVTRKDSMAATSLDGKNKEGRKTKKLSLRPSYDDWWNVFTPRLPDRHSRVRSSC